jgi:hypothetical protein
MEAFDVGLWLYVTKLRYDIGFTIFPKIKDAAFNDAFVSPETKA